MPGDEEEALHSLGFLCRRLGREGSQEGYEALGILGLRVDAMVTLAGLLFNAVITWDVG